eukprot:COSAG01_NODE_7575_length_3142_cov_1.938547_3_plen_164_part_00
MEAWAKRPAAAQQASARKDVVAGDVWWADGSASRSPVTPALHTAAAGGVGARHGGWVTLPKGARVRPAAKPKPAPAKPRAKSVATAKPHQRGGRVPAAGAWPTTQMRGYVAAAVAATAVAAPPKYDQKAPAAVVFWRRVHRASKRGAECSCVCVRVCVCERSL